MIKINNKIVNFFHLIFKKIYICNAFKGATGARQGIYENSGTTLSNLKCIEKVNYLQCCNTSDAT